MSSPPASAPSSTPGWARPAPVDLVGVERRFGPHTVLRAVDLAVPAGQVVALLGASGCGKSTLLRLVAGLDTPTSGEVRVDDQRVTGVGSRAAVVFQEPRLLPWRTLAGNVAFGLPRRTPATERREQVAAALAAVGLTAFAHHRPRAVSGGMAQRAALARALVRRPGVLLLDEPFAALDALTRLRMQDLVDDLQRRSHATVVLVTHDVEEALQLADRVVVLGRSPEHGPGEHEGSTVVHVVDVHAVVAERPRDRTDPRLAALRADLLTRLGVPTHAGGPTTALAAAGTTADSGDPR